MKQAARLHEKGPQYEIEFREVEPKVNEIGQRLTLPGQVETRAVAVCTEAMSKGLGQGFAPPVLAAASVYVACREGRSPVTLRELASLGGSDPREVGRCYLKMLEKMHISRPDLNGKRYVPHLALKKPVSRESLKLSEEIIKKASQKGIGGRNPMTLAAASLYIACCNLGEKVTQAEVAEAAGVGEESVRECCKELRPLAG